MCSKIFYIIIWRTISTHDACMMHFLRIEILYFKLLYFCYFTCIFLIFTTIVFRIVQHELMVKEFQGKWFIKPSHKYVWHTYDVLLHIHPVSSQRRHRIMTSFTRNTFMIQILQLKSNYDTSFIIFKLNLVWNDI